MKKTQTALILTAITSLALVGTALYFQINERMLPCPLCVLQRYAFITLAIGSLIALGSNDMKRKIGTSHPDISCGVDKVQTFVNNLPFADWLPLVFNADGMCGTPYDPILGLSIPQWSLTWFVIFTGTLLLVLFKGKPAAQK